VRLEYKGMMNISLLAFFLAQWMNLAISFSCNKVPLRSNRLPSKLLLIMSDNQQTKKALLDQSTLWRISLKLTMSGYKQIDAIARVRFIEDRNYEPPQGRLFIEDDFNGLIKVDDKG
jgi:hypothetical protein